MIKPCTLKIPTIHIDATPNTDQIYTAELKQARRHYPGWGTLLEPVDIELPAASMGCEGVTVDSAAGLERVLAGKRPSDRPLVVGARIDPSQYAAQF